MSFRTYAAHRQSGIPWLGEVPSHWEIVPLKRVATYNDETLDEHTPPEQEILYVDISSVDFLSGIRAKEAMPFGVAPSRARRKVRHGDVIVSTVRTYLRAIARVVEPEDNLVVSTGFAVVRPSEKLNHGFLGYLLSAGFFVDEVIARSVGVSYPAINASDLVGIKVPVPPVDEQQAIATFLDRETAKIDTLVTEQQHMIALLTEKRQAVISKAVTKGIDPNARMKDSGVEWLGKVPTHWAVMPIRLAARLESGHTPSRSHPEYWVPDECVFPWFTLADVWQLREEQVEYVYETKEKVSQTGLENSAARLLPKGTVMLSRTASVGYAGIMGVEMATTQDFANWVCSEKLAPEFLLYGFRAMKGEFERLKYGSTHNTIYMPDIMSFRFALPPLTEQAAIIKAIREEMDGYEQLITEAYRAVELLRERRAALISAAVTGRIDVSSTAALEAV